MNESNQKTTLSKGDTAFYRRMQREFDTDLKQLCRPVHADLKVKGYSPPPFNMAGVELLFRSHGSLLERHPEALKVVR